MKDSNIDITVCILNYNAGQMTKKCIDSILSNTNDIKIEIIVVDNKSTDESLQILEIIKDIEVIKSDYNSGFSRGNNLALKKAKGKYSILLNNDTELKNNALKILYNFMESHPNAGAVGPQLFFFSGEKQYSYGPFRSAFHRSSWEFFPELSKLKSFFYNTKVKTKKKGSDAKNKNYKIIGRPRGCAFMVKSENIKRVGYLDERFFMYNEETDWAFRFMNAGFDNYFVGDAEVYHHWAGSSSGNDHFFELVHTSSYYKYYRKHSGLKGEYLLRISFIIGAFLNILLFILNLKNDIKERLYLKQFKDKITKGFLYYDPLPNDTKIYLSKNNLKFY